MDYAALETLVARHSGWQLLRHPDALLAASFLSRAFMEANVGTLSRERLLEALEDELFALRRRLGETAFPRSAVDCLEEWAAPENGWLRKHYPAGSDDSHYELTPATAQALGWLAQLDDATIAAVDSRVQLMVDVLARLRDRADPDPGRRIEALRKRRDVIDAEIAQVAAGTVAVLEPLALKEHLGQLMRLSDELLLDFRLADDALRSYDQRLRAAAAQAESEDASDTLPGSFHDSDAARSLRCARERLFANREYQALSEAIADLLALPTVAAQHPDERMRRMPYAWLAASERMRRKLAERTEQLTRFARTRAWQARHEIEELLQRIEAHARARPDGRDGDISIRISGVMPARTLEHVPPFVPEDADESDIEAGSTPDDAADEAELPVAREALAARVEQALRLRSEVSLREVIEAYPLQHGLAELLAYLALAQTREAARIDPGTIEAIGWESVDGDGTRLRREAALPRVVFTQ